MAFDNAYEALGEYSDDTHWAFGTGFADPLAWAETALPAGVDGAALAAYCLMLGDDALIMSHRLEQWCTNAPELEDEVALANIGLDLIGQARVLYLRAGQTDGTDRGEDHYAFQRDEHEFRNVRLVETPNGDFAHTMARLLVFATWRLALLHRLTNSTDQVLAAIAAKGVKEVTYHRDYAAQWVIRLGDGTETSARRMHAGLDALWPLVDELFTTHPIETELVNVGVAVDPAGLRTEFDSVIDTVLTEAALSVPTAEALGGVSGRTGRDGVHTEAFGFIIAELQSVARAHPEATW